MGAGLVAVAEELVRFYIGAASGEEGSLTTEGAEIAEKSIRWVARADCERVTPIRRVT
jgi:hypothetical protein